MNYKNLSILLSLLFFFLLGAVLPVSASERLCDASFEDCRAPMLKLIQQENVEIDVAFWFIDDPVIGNALIKKIQSNPNLKVRMLVDPRSEDAHSGNTSILQEFATVTPPVPMRKRVAASILHWKMMLFAGQGTVEFSGANFSQGEMVPAKNYVNYTDEAIFYTDDAAIVNSFRTMYDKWWVDPVNFADYAHTSPPFVLAPSYSNSTNPPYPIETEVCATVTGGCGMDFLPSSRTKDDYGVKAISAINAEKNQLDIDMFRITNADITNATIAAFKRGVPVRMIVDASEYSNPNRVWVRYNVDRLFVAGVPLKITRHGGQNHEKSLLFYGQGLTVWGSSNWSAGSFNYGQEHNYFSTSSVKPWFFSWFQNHFERRWNSPQEYRAFVPIGPGGPPVYKVPANGATGVSQSLSLRWDGGPWGQLFDIYLGTGATGPLTLVATNVVTGDPDPAPSHVLGSYNISGLAPQTTYRWKIVSKTMANLTSTGAIWSFTTGGTAPTAGATVSSISPATGNGNGGTAVTITGTSFAPGAVVSFGVATASKVVVGNSTTITAITPPHVAGAANVTVRNAAGDQGLLANGFLYTSTPPSTQPQLNVIVPDTGSTGDTVTISGSNLTGTTLTIGGVPATITSHGPVSMTATTPAGSAGSPVDVVVKNAQGQTATLKAAFTYADPPPSPSIAAISPSSGSTNGGTPIVISGSGFRYGAVVSFGGQPPPVGTGIEAVTMFVTSDPTLCGPGVQVPCIVATTPPHTFGLTDVFVTNMNPATGLIDGGSGYNTQSAVYSFVTAPSLSSVTPSSGTVSGGTTITINGNNFVSGAQVFVANQAALVQTLTGTSITAIVPANSAQTAPVSVVNPDGQSSNTLIYTYQN